MVTDYETLIEPLRKKRTFEEVSERLKELIFNGTLKPGQQFPSENALAQLFQVGRQSVREALRVLELSGFITVRRGVKGGAVIEGTMLSKLSGIFLDTIKLHRVSLEDCIAARKAIEVSVLDFVLKNAGKEDIEALRNNIAATRRKGHPNKPPFEEIIDFHRLLAKASKNYTFSIVMESILAVFADFRSKYASPDLKESRHVVDLHEALVDAIVENNKARAVELLMEDLAVAEKIVLASEARTRSLWERRTKVEVSEATGSATKDR
jgi:GntR family transcriptional repressor for pyruvate dehydrogenase complex